jgi:hypothetical protein
MEIVNGYVCKTCCDVDLAKKGVDPAHPKDGPYGIDSTAAKDAKETKDGGHAAFGPAVTLGGALQATGANPGAGTEDPGDQSTASQGAGSPSASPPAGQAGATPAAGLQPGERVNLSV